MNTTSFISPVSPRAAAAVRSPVTMDQGDFLRLMTAQLQQQDPTDPVDNKALLAQMAQFSALAGSAQGNATLQAIADKLDTLIAAQAR